MQDIMTEMGHRSPSEAPVQKPTEEGFIWCPLSRAISNRLDSIMESWVGTGYVETARKKQRGTDCINLIAGIFDELLRNKEPSYLPVLAPGAGIHIEGQGDATVIALRDLAGLRIIHNKTVQPGDVVACRAEMGSGALQRSGHILMAGVRPWTLLHATSQDGVNWTGFGAIEKMIVGIYRSTDKSLWL